MATNEDDIRSAAKNYMAGMPDDDEDDIRSAAKNYMAGMPDDDEAPEAAPEADDDDKEADEVAKKSAFKELLSALGLNPKKADKAMAALEEFLGYCKDDE